jgi:hypothetical protein
MSVYKNRRGLEINIDDLTIINCHTTFEDNICFIRIEGFTEIEYELERITEETFLPIEKFIINPFYVGDWEYEEELRGKIAKAVFRQFKSGNDFDYTKLAESVFKALKVKPENTILFEEAM